MKKAFVNEFVINNDAAAMNALLNLSGFQELDNPFLVLECETKAGGEEGLMEHR